MSITRSHTVPYININYETKSDLIKAESALAKLDLFPKGNRLMYELGKLCGNDKTLLIIVSPNNTTGAIPTLTKSQINRFKVSESEYYIEHNHIANKLAQKKRFGIKGEGTSAIVNWNPSLSVNISNEGLQIAVNDEKQSFISLGHELIHAYRMLKGTYTGDHSDRYTVGTRSYQEEQRVLGIGIYEKKILSENSLRAEHNLNLRLKYTIDYNNSVIGN